MEAKQYIETNLEVLQLGARVSALDLDSFLEQITKTEKSAPKIVDEVKYSMAMQTLAKTKKLAETLKIFQVCFKECYGHLAMQKENAPNGEGQPSP